MIKFRTNPFFEWISSLTGIFILFCSCWSYSASLNVDILGPAQQKELAAELKVNSLKNLNLEQLDLLVHILQEKSEYDRVQIFQSSDGSLRLSLKTVEKIISVKVVGSSQFTSSEIESLFNIRAGQRYNPLGWREGLERLRQMYEEKAYLHADVSIQEKFVPGNGYQITILVQEGKQSHIGRIIFESTNRELAARLNNEFRKWHDVYNDAAVSRMSTVIRQILNKGRYLKAILQGPEAIFSGDDSLVEVHFQIENPVSFEFEFVGAKEITPFTLESDALQLDQFYSANPSIGPELANRIREFYLKRGYARVDVNSEEAATKKDNLRKVIFNIEEGSKIKIAKIIMSGKHSRPDEYYAEFIRDHSTPLVKSLYYNKEDVDIGLENLINELRNQGYLMAKISSMMRVQYTKDKRQVNIYINLDEGPQSIIADLEISGNTSFGREELLAIMNFPSSGPLRLNMLEEAIEKLKKFYQDSGYIEMSLQNEKSDLITYEDQNTKAHVHFKIQEGPLVKVASILLEGNDFSDDKLILLELEVGVGDVLTPTKIEDSISRIRKTGYFSAVEIHTLEERTSVANRTLIVRVTEVDPGLFKMGAGLTNELDLTSRGYIGIAYRNLRGTGRGLAARIDGRYNIAHIKYPEYKFTLGYLEPYLFNSRLRGRVNYVRDTSMVEFDIRHVTETNQTAFSIEKDFTSRVLGIWEILSVSDYRDYSIDPAQNYPDLQTHIGATGMTINMDFRDNAFNPTKGLLSILSMEYGSPALSSSRTIEYGRITGTFTYFYPFFNSRVVWGNQLRLGYLDNLQSSKESGVPYNKKGFILGGQSTIRGFAAGTSEVFPNKAQLGGIDNFNLNTNASMYLFKSELRFPLWREGFGGSLFYDRGSVKIAGSYFDPSFRDSAGFGFNIGTPFGPVNLEFAWKLNQQVGESPYQFYLSMGYF